MNYKVGDKVKIKSREWYKFNKDKYGAVYCGDIPFVKSMSKYCGKVLTIERIFDLNTPTYEMLEDPDHFDWNDGMIECLVESAPDNKISKIISRANKAVTESFENGAKFERERLAKLVENWCRLNTDWFDEYDNEGRNFNYGKAEELINLILGKE